MTLEFVKKTCPICGKEAEYSEIHSYSVFGAPNLDLKQNGSMRALGEEVQECPHCHYCNYDISKIVEKRFKNNLELWQNDEEIQEIIKTETGALRKYLVLAKMHEHNMDSFSLYHALIHASWAANDQKAKDYREKAIDVYIGNILPNKRSELFQLADLCRQNGHFDISNAILEAIHNLLNEEDESFEFEEDFVHYEFDLIDKEDSAPHNIDEIPEHHHHEE